MHGVYQTLILGFVCSSALYYLFSFNIFYLLMIVCLSVFCFYLVLWCLQCFDAVGWAAGRASGL